jgi:hypothetical protein
VSANVFRQKIADDINPHEALKSVQVCISSAEAYRGPDVVADSIFVS